MPYKTILVHLNNERRAGPLLEYAMALGEVFSSHIIGLYVFPAFRLNPPIRLPYSKELAGTLRGEIREEERRIRLVFQSVTKGYSNACEWRSVTTDRRAVAEVAIEHALAADIVVASQADPEWGFSDILDCPDRLAIESGRPMILVPKAGRFTNMPHTILAGWNAKREAARALFDSLPLLGSAQSVEILAIDERARDHSSLPDSELTAGLSRHGVHTSLKRQRPGPVSVGRMIEEHAADIKADLLVMGAYGRARLSEFVFGGVTRHLLNEVTIPVLFSH